MVGLKIDCWVELSMPGMQRRRSGCKKVTRKLCSKGSKKSYVFDGGV